MVDKPPQRTEKVLMLMMAEIHKELLEVKKQAKRNEELILLRWAQDSQEGKSGQK